ncbi:hypothetical protein KAR91_49985 [Candidatus Pacearchaeota archaeon]|nr:hypothetical protein [Candidatus Pacearchaeota archaeon]
MIKNELMGQTIGEVETVFKKKFTPIVNKINQEYEIKRNSDDEIPFESWTCTNTMKDGIGNVTTLDLDRGFCSVKAVLRGVEREFHNVVIWDNRIQSVYDRVMVTEHLRIDGKPELVATKERILKQDFNYFNFGWESVNCRRVITVDIYTGDSVMHEQGKE